MSQAPYIAHLASDTSPLETACGEPWQGWQEPFDADKVVLPDRYRVRPPHAKPRPHMDQIHQCQACLRRVMGTDPEQRGYARGFAQGIAYANARSQDESGPRSAVDGPGVAQGGPDPQETP